MIVSAASTRHVFSVLVAALVCLLFLTEGASGGERGKRTGYRGAIVRPRPRLRTSA